MSDLGHLSRCFPVVLLCSGLLMAITGCQATSGWTFNNSGRAYYERGQYAMARDEFYRASLDDPHNPDYRHNLAMALKKTGDTAGAERVLRQNLSLVSAMHQPSYHSLSQMLVEQHRHAEAQDLVQGWAVAQPYVPEAHVEMAWMQRELGNPAAAEQSLRQALQVNPQHPSAMAQLGQLYQDSGQTDRAAAMYQRSLANRWQQPQVQSRLQMIADGTGRNRPLTRSALMQNPLSVQPASSAYGSANPMSVVTSRPVTDTQAVMAAAPMLSPTPDTVISNSSGPQLMDAPQITFEPPVSSGPMLAPNADPAHVHTEMTAELPVVDPY